MPTEALIRITGLSASFEQRGNRTEVLHEIDLLVARGRTLGIVGESGSGKSVTSLSIMRLIPSPPIEYTQGRIHYQGENVDLLDMEMESIRTLRGNRIAMIFQEPMSSLNPLERCGAQVAEAILNHNRVSRDEARDQVLELFEKVKLPDPSRAYSSYPHELSGGQKQRVMIAMAISCRPELLIADEPTTALDVTVQREILDLLSELQEENGMAMIFISHDLAVISQIADEILVMHQGRIVEQGPADQIIYRPAHDYTRGLLASRPPLKGRPERLVTVADHLADTPPVHKLITAQERSADHKIIYNRPPLIEAKGLHTWYPIKKGLLGRTVDHVKAVNGVSLKLYPGETLGIVGESGCGKSTLGRTIIGLEQAQAGQLLYEGRDVRSMDKAEKDRFQREVQMIFQDPYSSLNPRISIGEAIKEPMTVHQLHSNAQERKDKVISLLERVGLQAEQYDRYPHEFSGGQRQRICIARTLALQPKVVICDESVSALDVSVQAQVLNLLNELKEEFGLSYLFISHDLSVIRYMSDKVIVMQAGAVMEYREADALYADPEHDYTRRLIASAYTLESSALND